MSLSFPSVVVPAGVEKTQCVLLRLSNDKPIHIGAIHNVLGEGSHHLIVYRVSDTEEKRDPFPCKPFTDTLDASKGSPLMVTQKKDDLLKLPEGVGYSIAANQMIRLEMHYINPSQVERTITAATTLVPIEDAKFRDEADFLFIGNPDIKIAPRSTATLGPTFFQLPSSLYGVKFFALTAHEHQYGTNVRISSTTAETDEGSMIYDVPNWKWDEPTTQIFEKPLVIPDSGGFKFTCEWNNTSNDVVKFGESANDEMCFFWAYYYPSQGAKVCFHTSRAGGAAGLDLCCPDHPLCTLLNDKLKESAP